MLQDQPIETLVSEMKAAAELAVHGDPTDVEPWVCIGCGAESPRKIKPCNCLSGLVMIKNDLRRHAEWRVEAGPHVPVHVPAANVLTLLASHTAQAERLSAIDKARAARDVQITGKSLGEKLFDAGEIEDPTGYSWAETDDDSKARIEGVSLAFAASLSHDETASAVITAQAEEIKALKESADEHALFDAEADQAFKDLDHQVSTLSTKLVEAEKLNELLRREAEMHAQEARTHKSSLHQAYQIVSGATGEPGNWNGAEWSTLTTQGERE